MSHKCGTHDYSVRHEKRTSFPPVQEIQWRLSGHDHGRSSGEPQVGTLHKTIKKVARNGKVIGKKVLKKRFNLLKCLEKMEKSPYEFKKKQSIL
jgi:hypothetical protein